MKNQKYRAREKDKNTYSKKGLLVGAAVSILFMFALFSWSFELTLIILLGLTIGGYFLLPDEKSRKTYKKNKFYVIGFILISGFILSIVLSSKIQRENHQGNIFYESSGSRALEGNISPDDITPEEFIDFPNKDYYFQARTDYFGFTNFTIDLNINDYVKKDFKNSFIGIWYYYDLDLDDSTLIKSLQFDLKQKGENLICGIPFNFTSSRYDHYQINYLFKIFLEMKNDPLKYIDVGARIEFNSNIQDDIVYTYKKINSYIQEGMLYEGAEGDENETRGDDAASKEIFQPSRGRGPAALALTGFILLMMYLFILVLCFVWQRFNIVQFMIIVYILLGIILLFWYVSWAANPSVEETEDGVNGVEDRLGVGFPFNVEWKWTIINFDPIRIILLIIITFVQWAILILIPLLIMTKITMVFGNLFKADEAAEKYEIKMSIRELARAVSSK